MQPIMLELLLYVGFSRHRIKQWALAKKLAFFKEDFWMITPASAGALCSNAAAARPTASCFRIGAFRRCCWSGAAAAEH